MGKNLGDLNLSLVSSRLMLTFFSLSQLTEYLIFKSVHNIPFVSKSVKMKHHHDLYPPQAGLHVLESQPTLVQWPRVRGNQQ